MKTQSFEYFMRNLIDHMKENGIKKVYKKESEVLSLEEILTKIKFQSR